jgi:hypothetical protein
MVAWFQVAVTVRCLGGTRLLIRPPHVAAHVARAQRKHVLVLLALSHYMTIIDMQAWSSYGIRTRTSPSSRRNIFICKVYAHEVGC